MAPSPLWGGRGGGGARRCANIFFSGTFDRIADNGQHAFEIPVDFIVPKAKDMITLTFEKFCAPCIMRGALFHTVLAAINFDNQLCHVAGEIYGIGSHRHLFAEMRGRKIFA